MTAASKPLDVWIDTDPSIGLLFHEADDGFALIQAFHSPELRIRGISTTYGNASLATTTRIAQEMVIRFGQLAKLILPHVHPGAASARDLGKPTAATVALRNALRRRPLTYLALAPLTNLATFLTLHPELVSRLERVIFVGGRTPGVRFRAGDWNPYEFTDGNFHKDHAAAVVLLASAVPLTLVPVECALQMFLLPAELRRLGREGSDSGRYLAKKARLWMILWRTLFGIPGGVVFDCFAILAATHPHLLESETRHAAITSAVPGKLIAKLRHVHLAACTERNDPSTRETLFLFRPLEEARAVLVTRLLARPS